MIANFLVKDNAAASKGDDDFFIKSVTFVVKVKLLKLYRECGAAENETLMNLAG